MQVKPVRGQQTEDGRKSGKANINKLKQSVCLYAVTTVRVTVADIIRLEGVADAVLQQRDEQAANETKDNLP